MLIVWPGTYPVDNVRMQGLAVRGLGGRWMSGIGVSCYASRAREAICREQLTNKDACVGPNTILYRKIAVLEVREGLVWEGLLSFVLFASSVNHEEG